jgi:hypothetical protein
MEGAILGMNAVPGARGKGKGCFVGYFSIFFSEELLLSGMKEV